MLYHVQFWLGGGDRPALDALHTFEIDTEGVGAAVAAWRKVWPEGKLFRADQAEAPMVGHRPMVRA